MSLQKLKKIPETFYRRPIIAQCLKLLNGQSTADSITKRPVKVG